MNRMKLSFMVRATQGSEFDTWLTIAGGSPVIRPTSAPKHGGWAGHRIDYSKLKNYVHALFRELGFPIEDWRAGTTVELSSPAFPELVRLLTHYQDAGQFYPASGTLWVEPVEDAARPFEWFYIKVPYTPQRFRNDLHESGKQLGFVCQADAADQKRDAMLEAGLSVVVTERFKELCGEFNGADFLWLKDVGRHAAPQWYLPIAHSPLGARVDHPWFDAAKRPPPLPSPSNKYRTGVHAFRREDFRSGVTLGFPEGDAMLSLFPTDDHLEFVQVIGPYMALRRFLPNADFAYLWNNAGGERHLCITRRVRDKLVESYMLKPNECIPIVVVDEPPPGAEILDGRVEIPPPLLYGDALVAAKAEAAQAYIEHISHPKPVRCVDLELALAALRDAKVKEPQSFRAGASTEEQELTAAAFPDGLPAAWRKVLETSDGFAFSLGDSFEVTRSGDLPSEHCAIQHAACAGRKDFPKTLLHVTRGFGGDWHSLDLSRLDSHGDCPVLQYDHETLQQQREWPCVGAFIEELLLETFADQDA